MLDQRLQQKLLQKLSPQQILLMKLLQVPTVALEQRIKQEIEENPALDIDEESADETTEEDYTSDDLTAEETDADVEPEYDSSDDEFELDDYISDDETPEYMLHSNNNSPDHESYDIPYSTGMSFHEMLEQQLGFRKLDENKHKIGLYIIGNIDDSGYLNRQVDAMADDLLFAANIKTTKEDLQEVLSVIQDFDPPGVGARNLQECLLLQLQRLQDENPEIDYSLPILIIDRFFNEFIKKHYSKIIKRAEISEDALKKALAEIMNLNPKPGNAFSEGNKITQYVTPDFIVSNNDNELELTLNSQNAPELRISRSYSEMLETYAANKGKNKQSNKDALMFVKQKIDSAKWFIDAIRQRQNTLYITMKAIMEYQKPYFLTGDETKLRPMILKDISEIVNLDISTISRVANSKYVQTPFGTFLLKSFFSESMQNEEGEEISTREIKSILSDCIESEKKAKPLTDEQLTGILKEKGYNIARRTVAKYREQLNIPVARLRKEL